MKEEKIPYTIKKIIVAGQEVEVKVYPEIKKRPTIEMKTRGRQTHDSTLGESPENAAQK